MTGYIKYMNCWEINACLILVMEHLEKPGIPTLKTKQIKSEVIMKSKKDLTLYQEQIIAGQIMTVIYPDTKILSR